MCFGCSKEPSHQDGSFEYPQHMCWLRNTINIFQLHTLILGPENLALMHSESESLKINTTKTCLLTNLNNENMMLLNCMVIVWPCDP